MKKKASLSGIAITGLVLAASSPLSGQALSGLQAGEAFHAGGACGNSSHGCGGNVPKDRGLDANRGDIRSQTGSYSQGNGYGSPSNRSGNMNDGHENRSWNGSTSNSINDQPVSYRDATTPSPTARMNYGADQTKYETELMRRGGYGYNAPPPPPPPVGNNREYNPSYQDRAYTDNAYQSGQRDASAEIYGQQYMQETEALPTVGGSVTLTEAQLLATLNAEGRAMYQGLDAQGKALAIQIASLESYRDKNLAVREAAQRMSRRAAMSR